MSVLEEIMRKVDEISLRYVSSLNDELKVAFDAIDKFAEDYARGKRETKNKAFVVLQSINEDEDEGSKEATSEKRLSQKRGKHEVDGMFSPEQEKRQKRNASVRAQNNITKQNLQALEILNRNIILLSDDEDAVNVNLTQKLRREDAAEKPSRRRKDADKENAEPLNVKIKQEKTSLPPEPMDMEATLDIQIKQETNKDELAMPPPTAPLPRSRRLQKGQSTDSEDEQAGKRSSRTRARKQAEAMPPPAAPAEPAPRGSRRGTRQPEPEAAPAPPEPRPKRTRAKKKISDTPTMETETAPPGNNCESPAAKPRPKRTRRGQKAAENEETQKPIEPKPEPEITTPEPERITQGNPSPTIPQKTIKKTKNTETTIDTISDDSVGPKNNPYPKAAKSKLQEASSLEENEVTGPKNNKSKAVKAKLQEASSLEENEVTESKNNKDNAKSKLQEAMSLEETHIICPMNSTVTIAMDKTVDLPNGVYDHTDGKYPNMMNATVVLDKMNRETMVLGKVQPAIMDATVVIDKEAAAEGTPNITDDNSILTDDSDAIVTPPQRDPPEPTSAVKVKVQQFEEMAARTTRTKTRAMAKKDAETENCTPPDKIGKQVLSVDTLNKMNNMIFNMKPTVQISVSASKPTAKLPPVKAVPASASKLGSCSRARDELEAGRDDAKKKKEAMLEAKKEQQKRKREDKMAAAAAARELAERERRAALQAAARDRMEKQAHADQGKLVRMKEAEKKKQELARKVAETEERRRAEEQARHARLAEEQKRADAARKKQLEESEAMKKEAAVMAKEIEKRQKEYLEKQRMKQRLETDKFHTPLKGAAPAMEPVHMRDGFQFLCSDSEEDEARPRAPCPPWEASKARNHQLALQHLLPTRLVDRLFSVRVHSPDLRAMFPGMERHALKRTSSAVWRTPPVLQLSRVHESPV